ncbi:MAG: hypothetical protein M3R17_13685 [Bacteroidota bacterium]|nr:hypothetical protein [Bacteroidota bacterium]
MDLRISFADIHSPRSTFQWLEEDEFTFNGRRYDVITMKGENNFLIAKCYDDTKEGTLYEKLKEHNDHENNLPCGNKRSTLKKGIEYDHSPFLFCCSSLHIPSGYTAAPPPFSIEVFRPVATPPPWFV